MMVALVEDLFFAARVEALARASGVEARVVTSVAEFGRLVADNNPSHVLLDLHMVDPVVLGIVGTVSHVAGFGPHVQRENFLMARQQGIRTLWANSALPDRLPSWLQQT